MRKIQLLAFLLLMISTSISGQCRLEIDITELKNNKGHILLQLFDENEKIINQVKSEIKENRVVIVFKDLNPGKYAFRYFHDENLSMKMETNKLGIPKEGYGFSNNGAGPFGPKPFKEWLFEIREDKKVLSKPKY